MMTDSRSIHISTSDLILFLSVAVCYFILCVYYIFCIHASVIGYVGCFYVLAVVKSEEQLLLFVPSQRGGLVTWALLELVAEGVC